MNIWEINSEIARFLTENTDPETGEITNTEVLGDLVLERSIKLESIALAVKNYRAEAEAVKAEKLALGERQKRLENTADRLSDILWEELSGEKFSTARVECSFRKSTVTEIFDIDKLPKKYLDLKPSPNKTRIKAAIQAGIKVRGAMLVERNSLTIK